MLDAFLELDCDPRDKEGCCIECGNYLQELNTFPGLYCNECKMEYYFPEPLQDEFEEDSDAI